MLVSLEQLKNHYRMNIKGVLHVGGHFGQESHSYNSLGIKDVIFFEPSKNSFDVCTQNIEKYGYEVENIALGATEGTVEMFTETANQGQSSSILKPALHTEQYPDIVFDGKETVNMITLDSYLKEKDKSKYNFLNMDVQGYELEVLYGSKEILKSIDYIYTEVNRAELYENCAMIEDLDKFLSEYGFVRELTNWAGVSWGDALYVKRKN